MNKINFNITDIRSLAASSSAFSKGLEYYKNSFVENIENKQSHDAYTKEKLTVFTSKVREKGYLHYNTSIMLDDDGNVADFACDCSDLAGSSGSCRHIVAAMLKIYRDYDRKVTFVRDLYSRKERFTEFSRQNRQLEELIETFESKITQSIKNKEREGTVKLEPILFISGRDSLGIEFRIGDKKKYVVKDAYTLANCIKNNTYTSYGKSLEFNHEISGFEKSSQPLALFLKDEAEDYRQIVSKTQGSFNSFNISGRHLKIMPYSLDAFFDLFEGSTVECHGYSYSHDTLTFVNGDPHVEFYIDKEGDNYIFTSDLLITFISSSRNNTYIIFEDKLYKCSEEFVNNVLPAINKIMLQHSKSLIFSESYMGRFCSAVLPQISKKASVKSSMQLIDKFRIKPLTSSIYLDTSSQGFLYANLVFTYDDIEINPLRSSSSDNVIARNLEEEAKIITSLENMGFMKTSVKYSMKDEDNIYEFLTSGINNLTKLCEVNVSDDFKKIKIKYPKTITMGVKLKSNLIEVDIDKLEFDTCELKDILNEYKKRKKYFRLKDGTFLNLDNDYFSTVEHIVDDLNVSGDELESGHFNLPKYRSLYLDSLIKNNSWVAASKEQKFKEMITNIKESDETDIELPKQLENIMRNYQKTGHKWLRVLSAYSLGGILADDMGLGKTLQVISILLSEKNVEDINKKNMPSIVICPTSLVYNWKSETERFAPEINSLIINGTQSQRLELIEKINSYDLILTSYEMLKRDIELYEGFEFNYCILDEAQYIKNSATQNAKAAKLLKSQVRFALTGTPIENSLADLWSIFDFIMPGFLLSYNKFKEKYEFPIVRGTDKDILKRLQRQIQPFILRRLKKDVLKELPDKIETVSYAQMDTIQKKLYTGELYKLNKEFNNEISENGYDKSQIKILAMLMRLRQLCCHPSLCYDNYGGESAKLDLCMEILTGSIENNHKILIFSQFTSMLDIIEAKLKNLGIGYYKLTGSTKSEERLELANKFNTDSTPVFLISLKAGGTGLNLTGADVVIHFDPWWNISAQNQATDRTHRIGQANKVQVFKLITKDTIEEKIEKLQQSKKDLADSVIKKGEIIINSLSREEINSLFQL